METEIISKITRWLLENERETEQKHRTFNGASFHNLWLPKMNADGSRNVTQEEYSRIVFLLNEEPL